MTRRRPQPPAPDAQASLNALTNAFAAAIATDGRVAALAAATPELCPISPAQGAWVLQGPCTGGGVLHACITAEDMLSILHHGTGHAPTHIRIPLAGLARAPRTAA